MYHCIACDRSFTSEETEIEALFGNESVAMCPVCFSVVEWQPPGTAIRGAGQGDGANGEGDGTGDLPEAFMMWPVDHGENGAA